MARTTIASPGFLDRLGDRVVVTDRSGGDLEVLRLRPELTADPAFEPDLKARAEQLAPFQHRAAARVRGISRLPGNDGRLAVVSDAAKGWRLSEVLQAAEHEGRHIHTSTVLFLLRQVASVVTAVQAVGPDIAHGALGPERVVLTPTGRVLVVEYVLGAALEHLPAVPADRMWKEYRLAVPPDAGALRFGPETDVLQLGIIALSLVHNRLLKRDEYPARLAELLDAGTESQVTGARQPLGRALRDWLEHALCLKQGVARWTMADAQRGLDWIVSAEGGYFSTPVGLDPLLQSVERFFTVPPAETGADATSSESRHDTTVRVRPRADAAPDPAPAPPAPAASTEDDDAGAGQDDDQPKAEEERATPAPTLTLVKSESPVRTALPPASEILGGTVDSDVTGNGRADALIVTSSPLAEFAAEHVTDPFPAPPDLVSENLTARPSWPVPVARSSEGPVVEEGPPGLAPVADMLSIDRPAGRRRSGWNGEAWQSRSTDRQPSGARTVVSNSGAAESQLASIATSASARISRSGGAATAAALQLDAPPALGSLVTAEAPPAAVKEPVSAPRSGSHPSVAASALETEETRDSEVPASAAPARPMFGLSHEAGGERRRGHSRPGLVWPAVAALVILCGGGFAAWRLLSSSPSTSTAQTSRRATASQPARTNLPTAPPAAVPQPAPSTPSAAPGASAVPEAAPATGSLQLVSPVVVRVSEKGQALGTSAAPIALAAGPHVLELSAEEFGYHATRAVEVRPGRVTRAPLALPNGSVNINATPWAEVLVDGERVGETPLGNVQLPIGSHEVRFRHPQLGEQVRTVMITAGTPGRLSVDMKQ